MLGTSDESDDDSDRNLLLKANLDESVVELVQDELAAKRAEVAGIPQPESCRLVVRGGGDTQLRFGVPYDYLRAEVHDEAPCRLCTHFKLQSSVSYKYSLYGDEVCTTLATAWMHKMQHFFNIWKSAGFDVAFKFSAGDLECELPESFKTLVESQPPKSVAQRIQQIVRLKPAAKFCV